MECIQMEMYDRGLDGIKTTTVCPYFTRTPMILKLGMRPTSTLVFTLLCDIHSHLSNE